MQELTWNITIVLVLALAVVCVLVAARSGEAADFAPIQQRANRLRAYYFWALVFIIRFLARVPRLATVAQP